MGKRVIHTGSHLLGAELRRLRGVRSLEEIAELSRSEPLSRRIRSVSLTTLSFVENAKAMPNVETLHALAVIYQVSAQHLLNLIVEERLCRDFPLPEDHETTVAAFQDSLAAGRWYDALTLAIHGERLAHQPSQKVAWQANRASCLYRVGLRTEAVDALTECVESPYLASSSRARAQLNLVELLIEVGRLRMADLVAAGTEHLVRDASDVEASTTLLRLQARIRLMAHESGLEDQPDRIVEAQRLLRSALEASANGNSLQDFAARVELAETHGFLGNALVAIRDLRRLLSEVEGREPVREAIAATALGIALARDGAGRAARPILEHAASVAFRHDQHVEAFRAYFELLCLSANDPMEHKRLLRRCKRLLPLLERRSVHVQKFEERMGATP